MAITNIHPIKSTLDLSIDYICDPEKTDDKILISSYNCAPEVAALEFNLTQQEASFRGKKNFISKGTEVLAHHLIQSFNPGEISPENAHEIGKQLAEEILKGQYEYVLTTHIDKDHVHNHIIFNAVNFVTHQKYRSNKYSYNVIRNANDRLCKENGLHVLEESENKGKDYKEYTEHKKGTSWKSQIKDEIDQLIPLSNSFEEFIKNLKASGYEVKEGKHISFRAPDQTRFTRGKSLGENYTAENIISRIINEKLSTRPASKTIRITDKISQFIDIQNNIKAQENLGFKHWAKINNIKQAAKTMNFLDDKKIQNYPELEFQLSEILQSFQSSNSEIREVQNRINEISTILKNLSNYKKVKPIYSEYQSIKNKKEQEAYYQKHAGEIIIFNSAKDALNHLRKGQNAFIPSDLKKEAQTLTKKKEALVSANQKIKKQMAEYQTIKSNLDSLLSNVHEKNKELSK